MGLFRRRDSDQSHESVTIAGAPVTQQDPMAGINEPSKMRTSLETVVTEVNRAGGRMPEGAVPAILELSDALMPLLDYIEKRPQKDVELIDLRALVDGYLPDAIDRFLDLPAQFTATHKSARGLTPAEEFVDQLGLLREGAEKTANAIYSGDSMAVSAQRHFLKDKFDTNPLNSINIPTEHPVE